MKNTLVVVLVLLSFSWLATAQADQQSNTNANMNMEDTVSKELIIAWRESVSDAEKDRIIAEYGGKLRRRFTIVSADTVLFENSSKLNDLKREPLVKKLERNQQLHYLFRHNKSDRGAVSLEDDENSSSTSYYRENPYPSWKYINHFDAAQKMVVQKKDILVAVIADGIEIYEPSLQKHLWINEIEKEGKPGVDDDGNGWIDDIKGITPISKFHHPTDHITEHTSLAVAAVSNYSDNRQLINPNGKVKILPIGAGFTDLFTNCESARGWHTNSLVIIESLEYATKMGADIIVIRGFVGYSELVLEAANNFDGLIIVSHDGDSHMEFRRKSLLLQSGFEHVIGVGSQRGFEGKEIGFGGKVDLCAVNGIDNKNYSGYMPSAGLVAGIAANLMSSYPHFTLQEIKELILGSATQKKAHINFSRTGGVLNAVGGYSGRSAGGMVYSSDWAKLKFLDSISGETRRFAFDKINRKYYFILEKQRGSNSSILSWDGVRKKKIKFNYDEKTRPNPFNIGYMHYNNRHDSLVIIDNSLDVWTFDGSSWEKRFSSPVLISSRISGAGYDENRDVYVMFLRSYGDRMAEYDWNNLKFIKNRFPGKIRGMRYDANTKMLVMIDADEKNDMVQGLWRYNGEGWTNDKVRRIPGIDGNFVFTEKQNEWYLFSNRWGRLDFNIWKVNGMKHEWLGFSAPRHFWHSYYSPNSKKIVCLGVDQDRNNHKINFSIWQFSGAIKPTWIDNMPLGQSDYTGDNKADLSLWHPATGELQIQNGKSVSLGKWGDTPVPGDYNGDGKVEFAVVQRTKGKSKWIFEDKVIRHGQFDDIPVPLDYDNDGKTDIAVFRKDTGKWYFKGKNPVAFGNPADLPVPADYNGDGRPELATYTPLTSTWHIQGMGDFQFGKPGDSPVPADYDGDGRKDIATWNPRKRLWTVMEWGSSKNLIKERFGSKWDIPVPGDYNGDGKAQLATYTPMKALWNIKGQPSVKFGSPGDVPLVRGN